MAATYDPSLPTARDRMRQVLGDTDVDPDSDALLPDETYDARLEEHGETLATAILAESLAARYGQEPDAVSVGGQVQVSWRDRCRTWLELAKRLRSVAASAVTAASATLGSTRPRRPGEDEHTEYWREWGPWRTN